MCLEIFFQKSFLRSSIVWDFIWNYTLFKKKTLNVPLKYFSKRIFWGLQLFEISFMTTPFHFNTSNVPLKYFSNKLFWRFFNSVKFIFVLHPLFQDFKYATKIFFPKKLFEIFNWLKYPLLLYIFFSRMCLRNKIWKFSLFEILFGITPFLSSPWMWIN